MENEEKKKPEELQDAEMEQVTGGIRKLSLDPDEEPEKPKHVGSIIIPF